MHGTPRQNTTPVGTAVTAAIASVALSVVGVVPGRLAARVDPAVPYGRWVRGVRACDTERAASVTLVEVGGSTGSTDGGGPSRIEVVSVAPKPPDGLEPEPRSSATPDLVPSVPFTVEDATTVVSETGPMWRKCL